MGPLAKLSDAVSAYEKAEKALVAAVERAYPIGAIVSATIGRARVRGPVVNHGGPGYNRGYIYIINEFTGKKRHFYAARRSTHDVAVEELPRTEDLRVREFPQ